jgi:hypothetical protein
VRISVIGIAVVLWCFFTATIAISKESSQEFLCGSPLSVPSYLIVTPSNKITLTANTVIKRGKVTLYRDELPVAWEEPYSYATFAHTAGYLLILTGLQDCVDVHARRLFIVFPDNRVVEQPLWASNWEDGFFFIGKRLTYWSEWFCVDENTEKPAGESYVFSFNPRSSRFEKKAVRTDLYCISKNRPRFIEFKRPTISRTPHAREAQ